MTDPACKDCRFFNAHQSPKNPHGDSLRGQCHYNPPVHVSERSMGYFVLVYGFDWCGRFEPKGQPEEHRRQIFDVYTGAVRDEQEGKKLPNVWGEEYNLLPNVLPREDAPPEEPEKADESMDESDSEDSAMSMSEFMDWQEKKLLELLQDDREAVEEYRKAFLKFIDEREKEEEEPPEETADTINPLQIGYEGILAQFISEETAEDTERRVKVSLEREKNAQIEEAMDEQIRRSRHAMERNAELIKQRLESAQEDAEPEPTVYGVPLSEYPDDLLGNDGVPTYEHMIEFLRRRYPKDVARRPELYTREEGDPILKGVIEGFTDNAFKREMYNQDLNAELIKQRLESAQEDAEPAQTDWERDQITTHNERYAERVRDIGRLAQNAYQRKMDESAADLGMGEEPTHPVTQAIRTLNRHPDFKDKFADFITSYRTGLGYQDIVAQVGMAMATLHFPDGQGIPMNRPGEKTMYFYGELWEFLSEPHNQSGIWLIDTERGFPPGPYQLRWENDRWYSDGELPKWPRA